MRRMTLGMLVAGAVALVAAESAQAQYWYGRGGRGGTSFSVSTPNFGFTYGQPYYGYGWGQPYYGYGSFNRPYGGYYGGGYYGSSFSSPYYGSRWYSTPSYGGWTYSSPVYSSGYAVPSTTYYGNPGWTTSGYYDTAGSTTYGGSSGSYRASYHEPGQQSGNQVLLHVTVPSPEARVWIEDQATQQAGMSRLYVSPALEPGNYTYTVRASWTENGREVTREQKVSVTPGQHAYANFTTGSRGDDRPGTDRPDAPRGQEPARDRTQGDRSADILNPVRPAGGDVLPPTQPGAKPAAGTAIAGKVVRVEDGRVVLSMTDGGRERTFRMANDARIMVNGQKADLNELRPGMRISVTPQTGSADTATQIEATRSPDPDKGSGERGLDNPPQ